MASTAPGLAMRARTGEHLLLQGQLLEHRFDHQIGLGRGLEADTAGDAGQTFGLRRLCQAAALDGCGIEIGHARKPAGQRGLVRLDQR